MKASLSGIIVNVALIHGVGLVLLSQQAPGPAQATVSPVQQAVQLRFVKTTPLRTDNKVDVEAIAATDVQTQQGITDQQAPVQAEEASLPSTRPDEPPIVEEYLPRPRLSTVPQSTKAVIVPFPPEFDGTGRYTTVLSLYIDEDGIVRRVRFDDAPLPPSMKDAARQAFLQAHFKPGQLHGQPVKSLIHVEVVFDNTPITSDTSHTML